MNLNAYTLIYMIYRRKKCVTLYSHHQGINIERGPFYLVNVYLNILKSVIHTHTHMRLMDLTCLI